MALAQSHTHHMLQLYTKFMALFRVATSEWFTGTITLNMGGEEGEREGGREGGREGERERGTYPFQDLRVVLLVVHEERDLPATAVSGIHLQTSHTHHSHTSH